MTFKEYFLAESIKSVQYPTQLSQQEMEDSFKNLSQIEINQLGTSNFVSKEQWPYFRKYMSLRSLEITLKTQYACKRRRP